MSEPGQSQRSPADAHSGARVSGPGPDNGFARNGAVRRPAETHPIDVHELFTDLGVACVPAFCDGLRFDLAAEGMGSLSATYPPAPDGAQSDDGATAYIHTVIDGQGPNGAKHAELSTSPGRLVIAVRTESTAGEPPFAGTITCTWREASRPTHSDPLVARLLADQAVARLRLETLGAALQKQLIRASNLEEALATNREIGQAIGILMATDHVTAEQAFEKLRTASQHTHRKLREIAADVTETGVLAVSPELLRAQARRTLDGQSEPSARVQRRTRGGEPCLVSDEA